MTFDRVLVKLHARFISWWRFSALVVKCSKFVVSLFLPASYSFPSRPLHPPLSPFRAPRFLPGCRCLLTRGGGRTRLVPSGCRGHGGTTSAVPSPFPCRRQVVFLRGRLPSFGLYVAICGLAPWRPTRLACRHFRSGKNVRDARYMWWPSAPVAGAGFCSLWALLPVLCPAVFGETGSFPSPHLCTRQTGRQID